MPERRITLYIYIYIQHLYNEWNLSTRPHTHTDASLKNRIVVIACDCFIAGLIFGTQNLIRDG